jgi:hypothetical protein
MASIPERYHGRNMNKNGNTVGVNENENSDQDTGRKGSKSNVTCTDINCG